MADIITLPLGLGFTLSAAPVDVTGIEGGFVYGDFGGVSLVVVHEGRLDDGVPVMVARTARAQRIKTSPESHNSRPNEVTTTCFDGQDVRIAARLYWADGSILDRRDVLSVQRHVFDVTTSIPTQVLVEELPPDSVLAGSLVRDDQSWGVDAVGYQFEDYVRGSTFEGGRRYTIEWIFIRNDQDRQRLPIRAHVGVRALLSRRSTRYGRRSSS